MATTLSSVDNPPTIADYGLIGDCRSAALVSKAGSIDWLCLPHFSDRSVFAAILDGRRGGHFAITPVTPVTARRRYADRSAVLETWFEGAGGAARLTDAFAVGGDACNLEPRREIVRILEGVRGVLTFDVHWGPRPDFGRAEPQLRSHGGDWCCRWRDELFLLRTEHPLSRRGNAGGGPLEIKAGERLCFSMAYDKGDIAVRLPLGDAAADRVERARRWWEAWSDGCGCVDPWRDQVLRSAITLKLLTFALSGAVVAAPTTSLPEWIGADRNWDYRYCWLRDATMTMRAFVGLGLRREAEAFLRWLLHATTLTRPRLQVVYDIFGHARLPEQSLDHLAGFRGSRPVRIGNGADRQLQLDGYGGVIAAAAAFVESGGQLQRDQLRLLAGFGETVCRLWREPDHGIWEIRGRRRHYTFSKLMCWVALDQLLALARMQDIELPTARIERERAAIADAIESRGFDRNLGSYVGELDGDWLDASLLLMPCLGYGDPRGARMRSTFDRIDKRLGRGALIRRYEQAPDTIKAPEGAFGICGFWAVEHLARAGEVDRAERRFEQLLGHANDLGLLAEEVDPATGEALGNFPQAFSHVGLINAALAIEAAREGWHGVR